MDVRPELLLLFFCISVPSLLPLCYGASSAINFDWFSPSVYGQTDLYSKNNETINTPEDFIVTNTSLILLNTFGVPSNRFIEFRLDFPNESTSYSFNFTAPRLFSITKSDAAFFVGGDNVLLQVPLNFSSYTSLPQYTTRFMLGLTMHKGLLYVSNYKCCRVIALNATNLNASVVVYGQPNLSATSTPNVSPTLGDLNRKTAVDCSGSFLWVADSSRGRVISYPLVNNGSSYIPQIVLGQQNDSTKMKSRDANTLWAPRGLAFSDNCSVMFVADEFRVVRYRAPYTTGQAAEGMLGFSSFSDDFYNITTNATTEATFNDVFAIAFRDYKNGTGKLFILDRANHRVLSGITTTTAPAIYPLYCSTANATTGKCQIQGNVAIGNNQRLALDNSSQLQIQGNLTLSEQATVNINQQQMIITTGDIVFAGELFLTIEEGDTMNSNNITVFTYQGSTGAFSSIEIKDEQSERRGCRKQGTAEYGATSMRVVMVTICSGESEGVKTGVIVGVVVGVGGCCIVAVTGLTIGVIIVMVYRARKKAIGRVNF